MGQDRFSSFLLSLCIHLGIFALVLLWPAPEPDLKQPVVIMNVDGFFTQGKSGKTTPNAKQLDPAQTPSRPRPSDIERPVEPPKITPIPPQPEPPKVEPQPVPPQVQPVQPPPPPKLDPSAVNIPKDISKNKTAQVPPTKNATAQVVPKKNATVPTPPAKNATAVKPPVSKNATAQTPPKKDPPKKDPPKNAARDALADLAKTVNRDSNRGTTRRETDSTSNTQSSAVNRELDNLASAIGGSGSDAEGTGPGGSGGDGVGQIGTYGQVIDSSIRPNWEYPGRVDRREMSAVVYIRVAADGTIISKKIVQSSGDSIFDGSLLRAIELTGVMLEPPPGGKPWEANLRFRP